MIHLRVINIHDPFITNLTPDELERLVYVEEGFATPHMSRYLDALHEAELADEVRDVVENHNLAFDDPEDLEEKLKALVDSSDLSVRKAVEVEKLLDAIDIVIDILQKPAKHGSEYAKAALAELVFVVSQVNEER